MNATARLLALPVAGALALAACGGDDELDAAAASDGPLVIATTSLWADVTSLVACDGLARVEHLIPIGADSHGYEPSLADRGRLEEATLVVANGLDLEEGLVDTLDAVADDGTAVFEVAEHLSTLPSEATDEHEGGDHGDEHHDEHEGGDHGDEHHDEHEGGDHDEHDHDGDDPHVWFDPTRVAEALPALGDALVAAGLDRDSVDECLAAAIAELEAVDAEVAELLTAVPIERRRLVTNHEALGYFADRYDFEIIGTVIPGGSTLGEVSPADLVELQEAITEAAVPAVFAEIGLTDDDITALADRLGVEVVSLHTESLGEPGTGAESYAGVMRSNATAIAGALG
jgi:ABC-type Zn uptake system ZnuABC Zn-binding protein ZnuA